MGFNVYWAALPSCGHDSLLAGFSCKVREDWKRRQCTVADAQNPNKGRGRTNVSGVYGSVTGIQKNCKWGHGKTSGHRSVTGAWLHGHGFTASRLSGYAKRNT